MKLYNFSFRIFICTFFLSISTICFTENFSYAEQTKEELAATISSNKDEIARLEQEIKDYQKKIGSTKEEAATLKGAISALEQRRTNLEKEIKVANYKIVVTESNLRDTESKITNSIDKISDINQNLKDLLRQSYEYNDTAQPFYSILSASKTFSDINNIFMEQNSVGEKLYDKVNLLKTIKQDLENTKKIFEEQKNELEDFQDDLKNKKIVVEQSKQEQNKLLKDTKNKEAIYQAQLAERSKKKTALESEIKDFESKLKAFTNLASLPKSGSGALSYPLKKVVITQYFGNTPFSTQNPQVYSGMGHNGIDFSAPIGTAIYSAADGTVIGVGDSDIACKGASFGRWILIKHTNGLSTLYAHLSDPMVSEGQVVTVGQKIGLSGNTGYSTGPHLHFAVYAASAVRVSGATEYKSKTCGTYLRIPIAPVSGYLNPLTYLQ